MYTMATVTNILANKAKETFTISPESSVYQALEMMVAKNVSALIIMDGEQIAGIFTERDYARKVILKGKASKETPVSDIMTKDLITVTAGTSIDDCMQLMTSKYIRHLPVVEEKKLIGIISIGDVVRQIIEDQKFLIENMGNYIGGA